MERTFKRRITLEESISMVHEVAGSVFHQQADGALRYTPALLDYAFRLAAAKYYGGYELTGNNAIDYEAAMDIDLEDMMRAHVDRAQLTGIRKAVTEQIRFLKEELHRNNTSLYPQLSKLLSAAGKELHTANQKLSSSDPDRLSRRLSEFAAKMQQKAPADPEGRKSK